MGLQFLFMDDNAPCHRTVAAEQLLESEDIERMDWPARSPDLIPIEHVWDFLGRRLAARTLPPVTIRELRLVLQDEWAAMPQQLIDTLILSMGRRCETCLAVREIISPTKDRMFLAGHLSQGCFGLQSHCAPCYFFNKASFYPSDFSFTNQSDVKPIGNVNKRYSQSENDVIPNHEAYQMTDGTFDYLYWQVAFPRSHHSRSRPSFLLKDNLDCLKSYPIKFGYPKDIKSKV
ncbi:transposable element Tcb2 transposase [Trichonephila clavipes]|nr:transposable element Tcb2 transposase [Trichonephila clavipes]